MKTETKCRRPLFSQRVKEIRAKKRKSWKEMCRLYGLKKSTFEDELYMGSEMPASTLAILCTFLEEPVEKILEGTEYETEIAGVTEALKKVSKVEQAKKTVVVAKPPSDAPYAVQPLTVLPLFERDIPLLNDGPQQNQKMRQWVLRTTDWNTGKLHKLVEILNNWLVYCESEESKLETRVFYGWLRGYPGFDKLPGTTLERLMLLSQDIAVLKENKLCA